MVRSPRRGAVAVGRGLFVSLEGIEGAGKSVQARALAEHLERSGGRVRLVREPGGTPVGERIREVLLFARDVPLSAEAQALLFSAARAQLTREVIRPALEAGMHVVADRFFDSTLAYQGYGHGANLDGLRAITTLAIGDLVPDMTVLLDLPIEQGLRRSRERSDQWDRFEADDEAFHRRVREGYLVLAGADPQRFFVVDADREQTEVSRMIAAHVDAALRVRSSRIAARP